ncbi:MAG: calcium-binding protein [Bradyrhizobium sp.]
MALIIGTKNKDILVGTNTDDSIFDMDGDDTIIAGDGNDAIFAGKGGDFISGGDGVDTLHYGASDAAVNVNLATHVGHGGYAEGDVIFEVENLIGSMFGDKLTGDSNANTIDGGDGNDIIHGGGGVDMLKGGDGNDMLYSDNSIASFNGGADIDTVDFSGRTASSYYSYQPGGVYVNLLHHIVDYDGPFHHEWGPEGTIVGVENVNGTNYADTLIGDFKNNVLAGNGGNDTLAGGLGNDTFVFARANGAVDFGNDTITDFAAGQDHLRIDHTIFGNFADVQQHMQQVGDDVVITYDANDSITLHNVQIANLHANDFQFV